MFWNKLKTAFRHMRASKGISLISIIGLAAAFTACILIALWAMQEYHTNQFHSRIDQIYNLGTQLYYGSKTSWSTGSPPAVAPAMKENFPEVQNACRLQNGEVPMALQYKEQLHKAPIQMGDAEVFEMFDFPLVRGSYEPCRTNPYTLIISQEAAQKFFGDEDPIGKTMRMNQELDMEVVGVMQDIPANSTIQFHYFAPLVLEEIMWQEGYTKTWYNCSFNAWLLLDPQTDIPTFKDKIKGFITANYPQSDSQPFVYPFKKVYLDLFHHRKVIHTMLYIGALILLIGCINFINLSTAASARRAASIGMHKVLGAPRREIITQFFIESIVISLLAMIPALLLAELLLPWFSHLADSPMVLFSSATLPILLALPLLAIVTGALAGIYPALILSGTPVSTILKQSTLRFGNKSIFRKILVVIQFALSITLIICTAVMVSQHRYLVHKELGYSTEHLVYIPLEGEIKQNPDLLRQKLATNPNIQAISCTARKTTAIWSNGSGWEWEGKPDDLDPYVTYQGVDADFCKTFEVPMRYGSFYTPASNGTGEIVINASFAEAMGIENPVGMELHHGNEHYTIIGVTQNFHFKSAKYAMEPLMMYYNENRDFGHLTFMYAYLRINGRTINRTLQQIETATRSLTPGYPYELHFVDDDIEALYRNEKQSASLLTAFALLAVCISAMGLFGLSVFLSRMRTKEIGIRKILGSSVWQILSLLGRQYIQWVAIANLLAWPAAWYLMSTWLQSYPYRIPLQPAIFIGAGCLTIVIAAATISVHILHTARQNPINSIRYE